MLSRIAALGRYAAAMGRVARHGLDERFGRAVGGHLGAISIVMQAGNTFCTADVVVE